MVKRGKCTILLLMLALLGAPCLPAQPGMSLEQAREEVRAAYDAYQRGEYADAARLARAVLADHPGDVEVRWAAPTAKHPAPEADIYDDEAFIRAQLEAARETGQEARIDIRGTWAREVLLRALFKLKDWHATARLAEEILREFPHSSGAWMDLRIARKHLAEAGNRLAPVVAYVSAEGLHPLGEASEKEGGLWAPIRGIEHVPGATVTWDTSTRTAAVSVGNSVMTLCPGRAEVLVDGVKRPLTSAPYVGHGRLTVPLRLLAKLLQRQVQWDAESRLALLVPSGT